jgi:putative zinc finger/helix-turn-helix YgiT family protein
MVCVFCMHDVMREKFITRRIHDGGFVLVVENFKISECDTCHSMLTTVMQSASNEVAISAEKEKSQTVLPADEIRRIRKKCKLSQVDASKLFGCGIVAFSKFENAEVAVSASIDLLLRLADELPDVLEWLSNRTAKTTSTVASK